MTCNYLALLHMGLSPPDNVLLAMSSLTMDLFSIGECASCKSMDNRLALYIMIRAMQQVEKFGFETYAVATVQEEIGLRGATTSAFGVDPDVGIAINVTIAADIPGVPDHERMRLT